MLSLITYFSYIRESKILQYFDYIIHENNIPLGELIDCPTFQRIVYILYFNAFKTFYFEI